MASASTSHLLRFVHLGDLHLTQAGLENHRDFRRAVDEINRHMAGSADFVVLPGDNADDGTPEQFALVKQELARLTLPWHAIVGDHDFKPRSLDAFYRTLQARRLPYAETIGGCRCIFLDLVSAGSGGPDFRVGAAQMQWLRLELAGLRASQDDAVVFMHTYPADLRDRAAALAALLDNSNVRLVDMGHTHYNELSNDGRTIYAAVRSTGQIEEGEVGFAIAAIDQGVVSWRFKPLESPWPFVLITSPSDRRLVIDRGAPMPLMAGRISVRASVWGGAGALDVTCRIGNGPVQRLTTAGRGLYTGEIDLPDRADDTGHCALYVSASDTQGNRDEDVIELANAPAAAPIRSTGSDRNSIGAWAHRHLLGTQLGPNRNGRHW